MTEAVTITQGTPIDRPPAELLAPALARLVGDEAVREARAKVLGGFLKTGLPHRRIEDWKYTDLRARLKKIAPQADAPDESAIARARELLAESDLDNARTLVLVDGHFVPSLSRGENGDGIRVRALRELLSDEANPARGDLLQSAVDDPVVALNAAMASDGVVVVVPAHLACDQPIHLVHVTTAVERSAFSRSFLRIGEGGRARLIERTLGPQGDGYQAFDTSVIWLGNGARLDHVRFNQDGEEGARLSSAIVTLGTKTQLNHFSLSVGGGISRYQCFARLIGEAAEANIHGAVLLGGRQHADTTLFLDHVEPGCISRETYHAVLDGEARSVFQGRIVVKPEAQKTDAKMMMRALLLSDGAEADHKPELEIYADDVQCGHGATSGELDENLLFYLRARGLPEKEAQALLVRAFIGNVIELIADEALRDIALDAAEQSLARRLR